MFMRREVLAGKIISPAESSKREKGSQRTGAGESNEWEQYTVISAAVFAPC
jgi:hypothetical protein